jgi:hypothetical protein
VLQQLELFPLKAADFSLNWSDQVCKNFSLNWSDQVCRNLSGYSAQRSNVDIQITDRRNVNKMTENVGFV